MDKWKKFLVGFLVLDLLILNGVMGWMVFGKKEISETEAKRESLTEEVLVMEVKDEEGGSDEEKVLNGNGTGRVRLWDESNKRAVDGSEISSSSGDWESKESGSLSLWNGKNQYILQARSETGYRVDAGGVKLRTIVEN